MNEGKRTAAQSSIQALCNEAREHEADCIHQKGMMMARLSARLVRRAYTDSRGSFFLIPNSRSAFWGIFCLHLMPEIMAQTTQAYIVAKRPGRCPKNMAAILSSALPRSLNFPLVLSKSPSPAFPSTLRRDIILTSVDLILIGLRIGTWVAVHWLRAHARPRARPRPQPGPRLRSRSRSR